MSFVPVVCKGRPPRLWTLPRRLATQTRSTSTTTLSAVPSTPRTLLPKFIGVRQLARAVGVTADELMRLAKVQRARKRFYTHEDGDVREFRDLSSIVFSFATAERIASEMTPPIPLRLIEIEPKVFEAVRHTGREDQSNSSDAQQQQQQQQQMEYSVPTIAVMGHVDHGKTTLLDTLQRRNNKIREALHEPGQITQKIRLSPAKLTHPDHADQQTVVTFVDTPGHGTFFRMRSHVSNWIDAVVLVVDVGEGVMPQTKEVLHHVSDAGVEFLVALNKVDVNDQKTVDKTLQSITEICGSFGLSRVPCYSISAVTGQGLSELVRDLFKIIERSRRKIITDPKKCQALIVEVSAVRGFGPTPTVVITQGTLQCGMTLVVGQASGVVKAILPSDASAPFYEGSKRISRLTPGQSGIVAFSWKVAGGKQKIGGVSQNIAIIPGDVMLSLPPAEIDKLLEYRRLTEGWQTSIRDQKSVPWEILRRFGYSPENEQSQVEPTDASGDETSSDENASNREPVYVVVKADSEGSLCTILDAIKEQTSAYPGLELDVVFEGVGAISPTDMKFAIAAQCPIFAFSIGPPSGSVSTVAQQHKIKIYSHNVFYELVKDFQTHLKLQQQ